MKNKGGSIVANKFVNIVLILAGAILIISIFYFIDWGGESDREICHDSVILRGTLPDTFGAKNLPSLSCTTKKICITDKLFRKGNCEEDFGGKFETIRISSELKKQDDEVNKIFAREMADCWAMIGEGKIQIFEREITSKKRCNICTRIAFDKDLMKKKEMFLGLGDYLATKQIPQKEISYASFLLLRNKADLDNLNGITARQKAIVFFEVDKSDFGENVGAIIGLGAGGVVGFLTKSVDVGKIAVLIGTILGYSAGGFVQDYFNENVEYISGHALIDYDEESLRGLECNPFDA